MFPTLHGDRNLNPLPAVSNPAVSTDARQVRSRRALNAALLGLLQEKPFEQITIREISTRAEIGYATFFRHYPAKEALLSDIASTEIAALLEMTMPLFRTVDSLASCVALCRWVAERRILWCALLTGGASATLRVEFIRQARELARHSPEPAGWLPPDLAVVHGTGGTIDLLAWWLNQNEEFPPERMAALLDRLLIAPLVGGAAQIQGRMAQA